MSIVLDASAVLALAFDEPGADKVVAALSNAVISTVNLSEVAAKLIEKGFVANEARTWLGALRLKVMPFDQEQAWKAAVLRASTRSKGLSLGDRACLSLAATLKAPALTTDQAWQSVAAGCRVEMVR
jgi:PIN domain nuclease of toxin-antitoxin system